MARRWSPPVALKSNEVAEAVLEPQHPFVVDHFKAYDGLARIAFLDGNTAVMLNQDHKVQFKEDK